LRIYKKLAAAYNWSIKEIDETDFETLVEFIANKPKDGNEYMTIGGKLYRKAKGVPSWL